MGIDDYTECSRCHKPGPYMGFCSTCEIAYKEEKKAKLIKERPEFEYAKERVIVHRCRVCKIDHETHKLAYDCCEPVDEVHQCGGCGADLPEDELGPTICKKCTAIIFPLI